jgi:hypothetical protein
MRNPAGGRTPPRVRSEKPNIYRVIRLYCALLLFLMTVFPAISWGQTQEKTKLTGSEPTPEPAISAILSAFDKYEVVAMPQGHGMQDLNDFIFR